MTDESSPHSELPALLSSRKYVFFDGALGTMLKAQSNAMREYEFKLGENPALLNISCPEAVCDVHKMYIEAGSDIICANTFFANAFSLKGLQYTTSEVITAAVKTAKRAAAEKEAHPLIALDMGSTGHILQPAGDISYEEAFDNFREIAIAGETAGADLAAIETMSDIEELRAAITAVRDNTALPVFATMTFDASGYTFMGCTPEKFAQTAESLGAAAIGLNCSLEPRRMFSIAERIVNTSKLPLIIKPNAGLPDTSGGYSIGPEEFAEQMLPYAQIGVKIIGGCCGTTPEYIKALREAFTG